jgi:hypothetical protein
MYFIFIDREDRLHQNPFGQSIIFSDLRIKKSLLIQTGSRSAKAAVYLPS